MIFNRFNCLAIARTGCVDCNGLGIRGVTANVNGHKELVETPCFCALRSIFRACYARLRYCVARQEHISTVSIETWCAHQGPRAFARRNEDFIADFCSIAKKSLTPAEHKVFRFHYLLGADWSLCCRYLGMTRGNYFHTIYRIEELLGRAFASVQPYALYPTSDYFGDVSAHQGPFMPRPLEVVKNILRPPLRPVRVEFLKAA